VLRERRLYSSGPVALSEWKRSPLIHRMALSDHIRLALLVVAHSSDLGTMIIIGLRSLSWRPTGCSERVWTHGVVLPGRRIVPDSLKKYNRCQASRPHLSFIATTQGIRSATLKRETCLIRLERRPFRLEMYLLSRYMYLCFFRRTYRQTYSVIFA